MLFVPFHWDAFSLDAARSLTVAIVRTSKTAVFVTEFVELAFKIVVSVERVFDDDIRASKGIIPATMHVAMNIAGTAWGGALDAHPCRCRLGCRGCHTYGTTLLTMQIMFGAVTLKTGGQCSSSTDFCARKGPCPPFSYLSDTLDIEDSCYGGSTAGAVIFFHSGNKVCIMIMILKWHG